MRAIITSYLFTILFLCLQTIFVNAQKSTQQITKTVAEPTDTEIQGSAVQVWDIGTVRNNGQHNNTNSVGEATLGAGNDTGVQSTGTSNTSSCPLMFVNIDLNQLESCSTSVLTLNYCNQGNASAHQVFIDLQLDSFLTINSASASYTSIAADLYRFNVGTVAASACSNIQLDVVVDCNNSLLNTEHCVEAIIQPDTACNTVLQAPLLGLESTCKGQKIEFKVLNYGPAISAAQQIKFIIIDDHLLIQGNPFILQQGILSMPANSSTVFNVNNANNSGYKIELRDSLNQLIAMSSVHHCGNSQMTTAIAYQYSHLFWNGSPLPFTDTRCLFNGAYVSESSVPDAEFFHVNQAENDKELVSVASVESRRQSLISIAPNPLTNQSVVRIPAADENDFMFSLYGSTGQLVFQKLVTKKDFVLYRADIGASGLYYYSLTHAGSVITTGKMKVH